MKQISSLTDNVIFEKPVSVVIADIDFTLIDFAKATNAAFDSLRQKVNVQFGDRISEIFYLLNEEHSHTNPESWGRYPEFKQTMGEIEKVEGVNITDSKFRKWSRESWLIIASKEQNLSFTKDEIINLRDFYWQTLLEHSVFYPDAEKFLDILKERSIPMILMTGSDSILKVNEDLTLEYDPENSRIYKLNRLKKLEIPNKAIIIGDPIDKPDMRFFDIVIKEIKKIGDFSNDSLVFLGDSPKADCEVPERLGYRAFLIKR